MTTLDTNEVVILLRSLQGTVEEGRLKANLLHKQERYETSKGKSSEEVLQSLQPVQEMLNKVTKLWIEVIELQRPVITVSILEYY